MRYGVFDRNYSVLFFKVIPHSLRMLTSHMTNRNGFVNIFFIKNERSGKMICFQAILARRCEFLCTGRIFLMTIFFGFNGESFEILYVVSDGY